MKNKIFKKEILKSQHGITLIALVITIIVLLILAGVSLNLVMGKQGILQQATGAVSKNDEAKLKEEVELALAELQTQYYRERYADQTTEKTYGEYVNDKLASGVKTSSGKTVKLDNGMITCDDEIFGIFDSTTGEINGNGTDTNSQSYNALHPEKHIPTGFAYKEGTVNTGYVISDNEGNEFVWIPVANDEAYAKKLGKNNWYLKSGSTGTDTAFDLNNEVSNGVQGDVLGVSSILETSVLSTLDANSPEYAVVKKAGGFWVGRYEAGIESVQHDNIAGVNGWSNDSATLNAYWEGKKSEIKTAQNMEPVRNIMQTEALSIANGWKSGNAGNGTVAFQSGLITGAQWDAVCKFIGWSIADGDCSSWGNYTNVAGTSYTGYHSTDCHSDWITNTITKGTSNNRFIFPTGKFVNANKGTTAKKNIYDIAGNVWEWTTEVPVYSASNSVLRGGGADHNGGGGLATGRYGKSSSTSSSDRHVGLRLVLYVQ